MIDRKSSKFYDTIVESLSVLALGPGWPRSQLFPLLFFLGCASGSFVLNDFKGFIKCFFSMCALCVNIHGSLYITAQYCRSHIHQHRHKSQNSQNISHISFSPEHVSMGCSHRQKSQKAQRLWVLCFNISFCCKKKFIDSSIYMKILNILSSVQDFARLRIFSR